MTKTFNSTQVEFEKLCALGGGLKGGPVMGKVLELLRASGRSLNAGAYEAMSEQMDAYPTANPWHVCFAVGLAWGHLAKLDLGFTGHVIGALENWNDADIAGAASFHLERGPEPIVQSLGGAHVLFEKVLLPKELPNNLELLGKAQERWLSPILSPSRPKYIGSWNATAMFMTALFAQPKLAATQLDKTPILPPGGPIFHGLQKLHKAGILKTKPAGSELDDEAFEPGALYENNQLLVELRKGASDWCMIDVHSGVYMLGTKDVRSASWI